MEAELNCSVEQLKGVGKKTAQLFEKVGVHTIRQLLWYFPRDYQQMEQWVPVKKAAELEDGSDCAVMAQVTGRPVLRRSGRPLVLARLTDAAGDTMEALWFNAPYMAGQLKAGTVCVFRGKIQHSGGKARLLQAQVFREEQYRQLMDRLWPLYSLTRNLSNKTITKCMEQALELAKGMPHPVPRELEEAYDLMPFEEALRLIHFPRGEKSLLRARQRMAFDEFFLFLLQMELEKARIAREPNRHVIRPCSRVDDYVRHLPYTLTGDQQQIWDQIRRDLSGTACMNRMVQGDVGSGKTILAFLAALSAACSGYQAVIMAPTEVLARQHYNSLTAVLDQWFPDLRGCLLTGSLTARERREAYDAIAAGRVQIIIGTHALIQENVQYADLGVVVTDEQHRFGVKQREALAGKGGYPHVMVMSATPIPRTLALVLYGDMDLSVMRDMPADRLPIKNCVIPKKSRPAAWKFIREQAGLGRQAYVICPMVEASEMLEGENVTDYTPALREALPGIRVEMLHGRMSPEEKDRIMEAYAGGEIQVLVSTTVIEVGIDVANASVMVIENAERFGLAQLHQLRGRVGRGKHQSYCIFIDGRGDGTDNPRLKVVQKSNDGFYIAGEDLKLRGPGDLFGIRQSGALEFQVADIYRDGKILEQASGAVHRMLETDPALEAPDHAGLRQYLSEMEYHTAL